MTDSTNNGGTKSTFHKINAPLPPESDVGMDGILPQCVTLRQWYAGMALQACVAASFNTSAEMARRNDIVEHIGATFDRAAKWAIRCADAMIAAETAVAEGRE